jgi:hypothetical protein
MRKLYPGNIIVLIAGFILLATSCTPGSCFDETEARVKATFYSLETGKILAPDSISLYGIDMDTNKIYDRDLKVQSAEFPLKASDVSCKFIIKINGVTDTMEFSYSNYPYLLSKECGYTYFYDLDTVVHSFNTIKSVSFEKKTITTFNEENMRIYY